MEAEKAKESEEQKEIEIDDIANMSTAFTLPARLAKKAADWQKRQGLPLEQDLSQPDSEPRKDGPSTKQR